VLGKTATTSLVGLVAKPTEKLLSIVAACQQNSAVESVKNGETNLDRRVGLNSLFGRAIRIGIQPAISPLVWIVR
jgi:hypothetical protein